MASNTIKVGDIVRPNHVGQDSSGRQINWNVYRGRLLAIYEIGNRTVADVAWFRDAKYVLPRSCYPLNDLEEAS
jgi:hypothetical protein